MISLRFHHFQEKEMKRRKCNNSKVKNQWTSSKTQRTEWEWDRLDKSHRRYTAFWLITQMLSLKSKDSSSLEKKKLISHTICLNLPIKWKKSLIYTCSRLNSFLCFSKSSMLCFIEHGGSSSSKSYFIFSTLFHSACRCSTLIISALIRLETTPSVQMKNQTLGQ